MSAAVVLVSGGLDSAVVLATAQRENDACHALTVDYGQRHRVELDAAVRVCKALNAASHIVVKLDLRAFGGSALTDEIDVPKDSIGHEGIPITYVPARNTIFLSLAMARAETLGANEIWIGVNAVDYSGYPDCRPEFIRAFETMANLATRAGVEGTHLRICAPLVNLTKAQIVQLGLDAGVDFSLTHSCYDPNVLGRACGHCDSCLIRSNAFRSLGIEDPSFAHFTAHE